MSNIFCRSLSLCFISTGPCAKNESQVKPSQEIQYLVKEFEVGGGMLEKISDYYYL